MSEQPMIQQMNPDLIVNQALLMVKKMGHSEAILFCENTVLQRHTEIENQEATGDYDPPRLIALRNSLKNWINVLWKVQQITPIILEQL